MTLRTDCIVSSRNLEREIQEMVMMTTMSELLEGCDGGRIIVAALTEFELGDAENWSRLYAIADYT